MLDKWMPSLCWTNKSSSSNRSCIFQRKRI